MKRALDHTSAWVLAASVLGASLLLSLGHWVVQTAGSAGSADEQRPNQSTTTPPSSLIGKPIPSRQAVRKTPPVARRPSVVALDNPPPRLLPRKDSEWAESAKASDMLTPGERAARPRCLAPLDAVSVLAPVRGDTPANTGWLPAASRNGQIARPTPLPPIRRQSPQACYAEPSPRLGSNALSFGESELVAPAEMADVAAAPSSPSLVDKMFLPPEPGRLPAHPEFAERDPAQRDAAEPANAEIEPVLAPLPDVAETAPPVPTLNVPDMVQAFPPVDEEAVANVEIAPANPPREPAETLAMPEPSLVLPLPPVAADGTVEKAPLSTADPPAERFVPLPPIDSTGSPDPEPQNNLASPSLIPLPPTGPTGPRLLPWNKPVPMGMIDRLFKPVAKEAQAKEARAREEEEQEAPVLSEVSEDKTISPKSESEDAVLLLLPPVEREEAPDTAQQRSWELELVAREADKHSRRGFELAGRKAYYSARMEFTRALRVLAQGLDTERKTNRHSQALAAGLHAMSEAEDFLPKAGHLEAELDLEAIVGAHRSPVLKDRDLSELTPLTAIRQYNTFAQEQLAEAAGHEVAGSMALCGLGKLYATIGDQQRGDGIISARTKAMLMFQAALLASPANHIASNELGVLLARNGRHRDARAAFELSVATHPTAEGWRNLALTCEQLGETERAYRAASQSLALRKRASQPASSADSAHGKIRWISPNELANTRGNVRTAAAIAGRTR